MTSTRPYLLRALYDWMLDNALTPQIVVDARSGEVRVPPAHVEDGRIVLNISPNAVRGLELGNEHVRFSARFSGISQAVSLPTCTVLAIVARENGAGMSFPPERGPDTPPPEPSPPRPTEPERGRSRLKVVK